MRKALIKRVWNHYIPRNIHTMMFPSMDRIFSAITKVDSTMVKATLCEVGHFILIVTVAAATLI